MSKFEIIFEIENSFEIFFDVKIHLKLCFDVKILLKLCFDKAELLTGDAVRTGRGCRFWRSSRRIDNLKLHLFTFSFTYIGLSVHPNFVLLRVSMASPINDSAYLQHA